MQINLLKNTSLLALVFLLLYACDTDYNLIGEDIAGHKHFDVKDTTISALAFNYKITPVASNELSINAIGVFKNSTFGTTIASVNKQVALSSYAPTIGNDPAIDSVFLYIPYFSTVKTTDAKGAKTYELDSIYGSKTEPFKLSIFESGYFMRDADPDSNFKDRQLYYNDQIADFDNLKVGTRINDYPDQNQNDYFYFSDKEIQEVKIKDSDTTRTRKKPGMYLKLSNSYFQEKILNADKTKLASADAFRDYFRGLFFKVEGASSKGSLAMIDFGQGVINIYYQKNTSDTDATRIDGTLTINLSGLTTNFLQEINTNATYAAALANADKVNGDERLYIKGGEGSMAIINLFGADADNNGVADELEKFREKEVLINEANLVFNIDPIAMAGTYEPRRIYLYDLKNKRPLTDYYADNTKNTQDAKKIKYIYGGLISKDDGYFSRGNTYKFRITNYINTLIKNKDSTNLQLGLVVTESINIVANNKLKTKNEYMEYVPQASVMNPLGTVLYGSKSTVPDDKRLKLQIYYTVKKPD